MLDRQDFSYRLMANSKRTPVLFLITFGSNGFKLVRIYIGVMNSKRDGHASILYTEQIGIRGLPGTSGRSASAFSLCTYCRLTIGSLMFLTSIIFWRY